MAIEHVLWPPLLASTLAAYLHRRQCMHALYLRALSVLCVCYVFTVCVLCECYPATPDSVFKNS